MFGWIKNRFRKGYEEDYDELRSSILSDRAFEPPKSDYVPEKKAYDDFTPRTKDVFEPVSAPSFPSSFEKPPEFTARNYELIDRLSVMESQISAIRSMTETINERLKNLE